MKGVALVATAKPPAVAKAAETAKFAEWDTLPSLTGIDAIVDYCHSVKVPVSRYRVVQAIEDGSLTAKRRLVSSAYSASPRDVRAWLTLFLRGAK